MGVLIRKVETINERTKKHTKEIKEIEKELRKILQNWRNRKK